MLLFANHNSTTDGFKWRWMKMACGENAKSFYGNRGISPDSRLGEGWLFRDAFNHAKSLKEKQDSWCENADEIINRHGEKHAYQFMDRVFPEELKYESLAALLRGNVLLHNHCYETYDLEMMIRHAKEFGYRVTTFHHALEAWRLADLLAAENISVAIFADHWAYKKEVFAYKYS